MVKSSAGNGGCVSFDYFLDLSFLDGRAGLIFFVLQTFWFRFLVDAKLFERRLVKANKRADKLISY